MAVHLACSILSQLIVFPDDWLIFFFQDLEIQLASVAEEKVRLGEKVKAAEDKLKETEGKHQVNMGASLVW